MMLFHPVEKTQVLELYAVVLRLMVVEMRDFYPESIGYSGRHEQHRGIKTRSAEYEAYRQIEQYIGCQITRRRHDITDMHIPVLECFVTSEVPVMVRYMMMGIGAVKIMLMEQVFHQRRNYDPCYHCYCKYHFISVIIQPVNLDIIYILLVTAVHVNLWLKYKRSTYSLPGLSPAVDLLYIVYIIMHRIYTWFYIPKYLIRRINI